MKTKKKEIKKKPYHNKNIQEKMFCDMLGHELIQHGQVLYCLSCKRSFNIKMLVAQHEKDHNVN